MTTNDLVYSIAARARALAGLALPDLRRCVASDTSHTEHAMQQESRYKSRGELIEDILTEEFCEEFPRDICERDA